MNVTASASLCCVRCWALCSFPLTMTAPADGESRASVHVRAMVLTEAAARTKGWTGETWEAMTCAECGITKNIPK